ncbi:hypothetical protein HDU79_001111 [Rhizoclosmatium sp. JEL0117]|nr:hypothetical protein HDU79_001111 [Rhizoclosmatium sp. JEL0117]
MPLESLLLAADEPDATPVIQSASATGQKDARLGLGPGLGVGVGDGDGDLDERSSSPLFPTPSSPPALPLPLPLPLPSLSIASSAPVASVAAAAAAAPGSTTLPLPTTAPPPPATATTAAATATSPPVSPQDPPPTEPPPPRSPVKALNPTPAPTIADTTKENIVASSRRSSGSSSHNQSAPSSSAAAPTSKPSRSSGVSSSASLTAKVQHKVVFVDPDDVNAPWWWPAIVVPQKEFQEFRKTVNIEIDEPKEGEYLVCYFEDGSFSTIPTTAATAFHPRQHPYTAYLNGSYGSNFKRDNAVRLATDYFENGVVPPSFAWLNGMPAVPLADLTALDAVPQGSNTKKSRTNNQQLGSIDATGTAKRNGNASRSGNGAPTATGSDTKKRRDPNGANGSGTRKV